MESINNPKHRRELVKGLTCHDKDSKEIDDDGPYWICDKNNKECLIEGRCPNE